MGAEDSVDVGVHFNKLPKQTAPSSVLCMSGFRQRIGSINLGCSSGVRVPKTPGARIVGLKVHPTSTQGRKNPPRSAIASHSVIFAEIGTIKMGIDAAAAAAGGGVDSPGLWTSQEANALLLSTLAGLATTVGAGIAVLRRPGPKLLAFLLGMAFGVMFTLSAAEMWINNAVEHGWLYITAFVAVGAAAFLLLSPLIPDGTAPYAPVPRAEPKERSSDDEAPPRPYHPPPSASGAPTSPSKVSPGELMRLGVLMAATMTAHNLPEGVAVGASAMTSLGPVMALAIAVHNIPEGVVVAAPIYAATGSRAKALLVATLSGLSEPLGALLALTLLRHVVSEEWLEAMLAAVGGVMLAVCVKELWPEGRKCGHNAALYQGIAVGSVAMLWTLWVGV